MPTIKIADPPAPPCRHPDHNPPSMRVFAPGTYQHTCPRCGATSTFVVEKPRLDAARRSQLRLCNSINAHLDGRYPT